MKRFINVKTVYGVETVDEMEVKTFTDRKALKKLVNNYNFADPYNTYYISQRSTKDWNK